MSQIECPKLSPIIMEHIKKANVELYQFTGTEMPQYLKDWLKTKPKVMKKVNIFQKFINKVACICEK